MTGGDNVRCMLNSVVGDAYISAKAVAGPPTHALDEPLGTSHGSGGGGSADAEGMGGNVGYALRGGNENVIKVFPR